MSNKPRYLYKYHAFNLYTMELLQNGTFYMATQQELNDPLDSKYQLSFENYLKLYLEKRPYFERDSDYLQLIRDIWQWKPGDDLEWVKDLDEASYKSILNSRITCFTEDGMNPLMWAHYAQNFTGVCLRFDLTLDSKLAEAVQPVRYLDELTEVKHNDDFKKSLLTKLKPWSQEREWRIVVEADRFAFNKDALVEITLGHKVPNTTINWFSDFCENAYYNHSRISKLRIKYNRLVKTDKYDDDIAPEDDVVVQLPSWFKPFSSKSPLDGIDL